MRIFYVFRYIAITLLVFQQGIAQIDSTVGSNREKSDLFIGDEPLNLKIIGDVRSLLRDRSDSPQYYPITMEYTEKDSNVMSMDLKAKTRGNFRLRIARCSYPPLWLNFPKKKIPEHSLFSGQDKLKLVVPCMGEDHVIREYLVYKMYNLFTDYSFRVRLVRIHFTDVSNNKKHDPQLAFLLEANVLMAERNDAEIFKRDRIKGKYLSRSHFLRMAVFQYLIGNTDWSTEYRHNINLLKNTGESFPIPVPYDFDQCGFVGAPYAKPSEALKLSSVRERRYRGFCIDDLQELSEVFNIFVDRRNDILELINDHKLLDDKSRKYLVKYVEEFYGIINDEKKRERAFSYPCLENGTANVIIRGLN